ncbi:hypothetical protein HOY80DRAFT_886167 [Tuber brumale]|nr:hypothetical protein HOY80DRAFT_886167 [Tuber brumale]
MEAPEDGLEDLDHSDAESIGSLSSRAQRMNEMLSDSDSSIEGRASTDGERTFTSLSSYDEPRTPKSPAPEYSAHGFPMIESSDEKNPELFRRYSVEPSPTYQRDSVSTIGPKGPHLFRSYSSSHATSITHITIPHSGIVMPPTPSASASPSSPPAAVSPSHFPAPPQTPHYPEAPQVRPMSELSAVVSDYEIDEVKSWSPKQVCAWMVALGFERELVEKFERNDISGAILVDLKWEDLKELDIHSFGKRIELWSEIHHLRARTATSPPMAQEPFVRTSSRVSRNSSTRSKTSRSPKLARGSQMVVREVGHMRSSSGAKALPDLPTLLPRSDRRKEKAISEREESSDEEHASRPIRQMRKRGRKTNVRVPKKQQFSVESIDSETASSEPAFEQYGHSLRYMPSIDDIEGHVVIRARRAKSPAARRRRKSVVEVLPNEILRKPSTRHKCRKHDGKCEHKHHKKPHRCNKGDRCRKHGANSSGSKSSGSKRAPSLEHGTILIATTPSIADANPPRISALYSGSERPTRPGSLATISVLASSDVLGPTHGPEVKLRENTLKDVARMDPLENVKQFLTLQHLQHLEERRESPPPVPTKSAEHLARARGTYMPPTPSATPSPPLLPRNDSLLPPTSSHSAKSVLVPLAPAIQLPPTPTPSPPMRSQTPSLGLRIQGMERPAPPSINNATSPISRMRSPSNLLRTTTPFSEADVPYPSATPVPRNMSNSAPPDMRFRRFPTPDFSQQHSNPPLPTTPLPLPSRRGTSASTSQFRPQPLHMTVVDENAEWEPVDEDEEVKMAPSPNPSKMHSGWMKKRRTNWFRHEWADYHFVLKGTRLGYTKNTEKEDGFIEMDNYSVSCSNSASHKLSAAFKGARLFGRKTGGVGEGTGAYFFQLVPAAPEGGRNTVGKVHYFAVGSREERIDWMRELMLAKAIKQKKEGFEVEVNGERI